MPLPVFAQDGGVQNGGVQNGGVPTDVSADVPLSVNGRVQADVPASDGAQNGDGAQKGDDSVVAEPPADSPPTVNKTEAASPPTGEIKPDEGPPEGARKISDKGLTGDAPTALPAVADDATDNATVDGADGDAVAADAAGVEVAAAIPVADMNPHDQPGGVAAHLANWVAATHDNGKRPFAIIDKLGARMFVFAPDGTLLGAAPVLVGLARGDDSQAGIGTKALAAISPKERTTPAGRFVAKFGPAAGEHKTVLWVDYGDDIALHPVITTNPKEHRLKRIKSNSAADHRISFGCINVPATFYDKVVLTSFRKRGGIVYILPDTRPIQEIFPAFGASLGAVDASEQAGPAARADAGAADAQVADPLAVYPVATDPALVGPAPGTDQAAVETQPPQTTAAHASKHHGHRTSHAGVTVQAAADPSAGAEAAAQGDPAKGDPPQTDQAQADAGQADAGQADAGQGAQAQPTQHAAAHAGKHHGRGSARATRTKATTPA